MNVTSRQLSAFLAVAREGSFARAAERMSMTPSGISSLIRELEGQLGFRLFDRTTRSVRLTSFGEAFQPVAASSVTSIERAVASIARSASASDATLVVGATPTIAANLLPSVVAAFVAANPGAHVRLVDAELAEIMQGLDRGELDLGLGMFLKPAPGVRRTQIIRSPLMAMRPARGGGKRRGSITWTELAASPLVALPADNPLQEIVEAHLPRDAGPRDADRVVNYLATQASMVEAGFGSAVVPAFILPAHRGRRIHVARLENPTVEVDLFEVRSRARKLPPIADRFEAFLIAAVSEWVRKAEGQPVRGVLDTRT